MGDGCAIPTTTLGLTRGNSKGRDNGDLSWVGDQLMILSGTISSVHRVYYRLRGKDVSLGGLTGDCLYRMVLGSTAFYHVYYRSFPLHLVWVSLGTFGSHRSKRSKDAVR